MCRENTHITLSSVYSEISRLLIYTFSREDYTVCFVECECLRGCRVFDKFRNWRNTDEPGKPCPACQHKNEEDAITCKLCFYQLQKPSFQQDSGPNEEITSDLFDELLGDFDTEESEEIIDWSKTTFQIDDVTIDVQQYDDDDGIVVSQNPSFALTVDHPEPSDEEEDYVLKPEDAPEFVTKFEMPEEEVKEFEEITYKPVELVQPAGEDFASEPPLYPEPEAELEAEPEAELEPEPEAELEPELEPEPEPDLPLIENRAVPPPPLIPPIPPSDEVLAPMPPPPLPPVPVISADQILSSIPLEEPNYWPWPQQEKWTERDVALQVKSAMEAARAKDTAQATVLLDEVGPHLGNRSKLIYPIGALLQRIGRSQSVDKMFENASILIPDDNNLITAKKKLRP